MTTSNNVVIFPKYKKDAPPLSMEQLLSEVSKTRAAHIDYVLDDIMANFYNESLLNGFDLSGNEFIKINTLIAESMKSALMLSIGQEHFLQLFAEEVIQFENEEAKDDNS